MTISGQVLIASRLTQQLDIRLLATTITKETTETLNAMSTLPSYIMEHDKVSFSIDDYSETCYMRPKAEGSRKCGLCLHAGGLSTLVYPNILWFQFRNLNPLVILQYL